MGGGGGAIMLGGGKPIIIPGALIIIGGGTWPDCSRISRSRTESSFAPALKELQCS
jgi:hypothetical protein